jgi:hypothetical protein
MGVVAVGAMVAATGGTGPGFQQVLLPFELWTTENV